WSSRTRRVSAVLPAVRSPGCCACRPRESRSPSYVLAINSPCASPASRHRMPHMLKTVALSAAAALVIAVDWLRFEEPRSGGGRPFVLAALAIAAVLLRPLWLRLLGVALAALIAVSVAFSLSPLALWPDGDGFFGPIGSRFSRGFLDFYDFRLPIDPTAPPGMALGIPVTIFGFTLAVALAVASRHALLAVVFFFIGAGW